MEEPQSMKAPYWREIVLLVVAVAGMATSVILIRLSALDALVLSAYRLVLACVVLLPLGWKYWWRYRGQLEAGWWRVTILPGVLLGVHFYFWVVGARATLAANATLTVNMVPVVLPLMLWLVVGERVRWREMLGTVVGLSGLILLFVGKLQIGGESLKGDVYCLLAMLFLAAYIAASRRAGRRLPSNYLYVLPVFAMAALVNALGQLASGGGFPLPGMREWLLLACLVVFPTILGHGLMARSLRTVRGQVAGVFNVSQFLFASFYAWLIFAEVPQMLFWPSAGLVVVGSAIVLRR